jgi:type 1 fimbria pilin
MVVVALLFLAVGMMFVASGIQLAPRDRAAAAVFATDRSCTASLSGDVAPGACTVVAAQVLVAAMRTGSFARTRSKTPYVYVRLADGTFRTADLDGSAGRDFVETVRSGATARAQLFRGTLVRIVSGSSSAETDAAPDISAATDSQMPWVGAVLIAISALFAFSAMRAARRAPKAA